MDNRIMNSMFTLIESTLLYCLINSIMSSRFSGKKKLFAIAVAVLIDTALVLYLLNYSTTIKFLLFFITSLILTHIIYIGKIYIKAFFILVTYYIFLISDVLVGNLSSYIRDMNIQKMLNLSTASFEFSVLAKILNVILVIIFIYYFGKNKFEISQKYWTTMDVIVLLFTIILQFVMKISPLLQKKSSGYSIYIFGISIGFLIIIGLFIYFFGEICLYHEKEKENYVLSMRNYSLEQQLAYHESATTDLKKIRHDINKNLTTIYSLLEQNHVNESITYIGEITKALERTKPIVNCGNDIINAILNYKIIVCKQHNIDFRVDIDQIPKLSISPMDLTAIIANILDNAIEALDTIGIGQRYITGKIFCYKNYISIVVSNPYSNHLIIDHGKINTHKADKLYHGYGLISIKASVKKYGGSFKIYVQNSIFKVVVMLPIEMNARQYPTNFTVR